MEESEVNMWDMIVGELDHAMQELARSFAHLLPRLLAMLIIALLGWAVAYVVKIALRGILRVVKFDKLSDNTGATQLLTKAALPSSSELLSRVVFWLVWLGFIVLGVQVLGIVGLQEHIANFFLYLPRLFVALFIVFFGLVAASFFSRAALLAAVNADFPSPRLLATAIRTIIVIFAVAMAFEHLGLADRTILVAFSIAFGALMLGLAIAFGTGGRDLAKQFLERRFLKEKEEQKQDELSPL
jgi:Mechanosensitive ion channel, conserved TM helix